MEKSFRDLHGGLFRYDFYLPQYNAIIEVNGQQHYTEAWGGRTKLMKQKENDRRKISYALANNIAIYIIPYWDINKINTLEDILNKKYQATSRWFNDEQWKLYQNNRKI